MARYGSEAYDAQLKRQAEWQAAHREQQREYCRRYDATHNRLRWPLGLPVYTEAGGFWHEGTIVGRVNNQTCTVQLKAGGVVQRTTWQLRREPPFPVVDL